MRQYTLELRSAADLDAAIARVESAGGQVEQQRGGALVTDPSGTRLLLATAATS
jgi:predicted enzyme related to lactoylglutathione lyase